MKKNLIVLLVLLLPALSGYSQLSWNMKAGMNLSRVTGRSFGEIDMKPGYQFGVGVDYYFNNNWGIQPSLMLVSKGCKSKGDYFIPAEMENPPFELKYNYTDNRIYVEMPVMLAYRFNISNDIKMILNGGGYISYGVGGKVKNKITSDGSVSKESFNTFSDRVEKFDTGIGAGVAFEYKNKYVVSLFGEWGLKSALGDSKNQMYGLSIGYKFYN